MNLWGSSTGNGAGCPTLRADSAGKLQTLLVNSRNSSGDMVDSRPSTFGRLKFSLENTRMYSWMSLSVGLAADIQLPHAVEGLALAALSQMISPRMRKPRSSKSSIMKAWSGRYGRRPRFAMLMHALPPGTSTRCTSAITRLRNARYWSSVRSSSYSLPTL